MRTTSLALAALLAHCDSSTTTQVDAAQPDGAAGSTDAAPNPADAQPVDAEPTATPDAARGNYAFPCLGEREPTGEATFEAIYFDVFCKIGCTDGYCHGPRGGWGGLTMTTIEGAYTALLDQPTGNLIPVDGRETCRDSELLRVEPGAPERSLLYLKVTAKAPCGQPMPPPDSGRKALSAEEREQVRRWIEAGAPL